MMIGNGEVRGLSQQTAAAPTLDTNKTRAFGPSTALGAVDTAILRLLLVKVSALSRRSGSEGGEPISGGSTTLAEALHSGFNCAGGIEGVK